MGWRMPDVLLVGGGGAAGAVCRFVVATWCVRRWGAAFPYGTLIINLTGSFLFGLFVGFAVSLLRAPEWRLGLAIGFLGGYTTFSTFAYDTLTLVREHKTARAALYVGATMLGGVLAVVGGLVLAGVWVM